MPFLIGGLLKTDSLSFRYLTGQLLLWAVFQVIAVPCIYLRASFSTLFWIYTPVTIGLSATGFYVLQNRMKAEKKTSIEMKKRNLFSSISPFLVAALIVIAFQCCMYIFGMHLDNDDARWIAEANDALAKNMMLLHNPATGVYIGRFVGEMVKDVFSPWSMYLAVLSRWTGIRAVVIAHTVYPPILLGMSYAAYYETGNQLFKGKNERGIFLLMVSLINLFMAGNTRTQSVFSLTRIWQGKAVVAAVVIPVILAVVLRLLHTDSVQEWLLLVLAGMSCCLFSGMGIAIGLIMTGVYGVYALTYTIVNAIQKKEHSLQYRVKCVALWLMSISPSIVYGIGYLRLKG